MHLLIKIIYVAHIIIQILIMNVFLSDVYNLWEMQNVLYKNEFSSIFPLVTQCSFQVRQLQNVQTYTVQCVLLYNAFNEKKKKIYIYICGFGL